MSFPPIWSCKMLKRRVSLLTGCKFSGTAERSQIQQRVSHQLHAIVPLLDAFKSEQESLELVFPRKGPFDTHPQRMDGFVEQPLAPALGRLAVEGSGHFRAFLYTYCMPLFSLLLPHVTSCYYNRFPTSTQHRQAKVRRRKDDTRVGTATRGFVERLHRFPQRL